MRRFRFRIGTLLVLIIVLGVGFAALRESNDTWDSGVFTLALGAMHGLTFLILDENSATVPGLLVPFYDGEVPHAVGIIGFELLIAVSIRDLRPATQSSLPCSSTRPESRSTA